MVFVSKRQPGRSLGLVRPVGWADSSFSVATPERDVSGILAFEAGAEKELAADADAVEIRRAIRQARQAFDEITDLNGANSGEPTDESLRRAKLIEQVGVLAKEYVVRYKKALKAVDIRLAQGRPAIDSDDYIEFRRKVGEFGEQAAVLARRSGRQRSVLVYVGPDSPGVAAKIAGPVAASQFNVEAATMAVICNLVTTAMVVSAPRSPDAVSKCAGIVPDAVVDTAALLEREIRLGFAEEGGSTLSVLPRPAIPEIIWPRPGSTVWHLRATTGSTNDVIVVTREIAERGLALLTYSTWIEAKAQVIDLTLALPPDAGNDLSDAGEILLGLQNSLEAYLGRGSVSVSPADRPTRGAPDISMRVPEGARVVTVVGEARPGFVHAVLDGMATFPDARLRVSGANMAILEVFSVLTVVVSLNDGASPDFDGDWSNLAAHIRAGLRGDDEVLEPCSVSHSDAPTRHQPSHTLTVESAEQPGVLAKVSDLLAGSSPQVNIAWLSSYVLEPRVGEDRLRCWMQLHVDLSDRDEGAIDLLQQNLGWLAQQNRWEYQVLRRIGGVK